MRVAKEDPCDSHRGKSTDDGIKERSGVGEGLVSVISAQHMADDPDLISDNSLLDLLFGQSFPKLQARR